MAPFVPPLQVLYIEIRIATGAHEGEKETGENEHTPRECYASRTMLHGDDVPDSVRHHSTQAFFSFHPEYLANRGSG